MDDYYEEKERASWYANLSEHEKAGLAFLEYPDLLADPSLIDCEDFEFQEEAQAFFDGLNGSDWDYFLLDEDRDFYACELLPNWELGTRWFPGVNFEVP